MSTWIIGKYGMLAKSFIKFFQSQGLPYIATSSKQVDITDALSIERFLEKKSIHTAINCAAFTNVDGSEKNREEAHLLNGKAPMLLAQALGKRNTRLIHFSTDFVFDGYCKGGFSEKDEAQGSSAYGKTKLAGDKALLKAGGNILILRISWLYGEGENHFVGKIVKKLQAGETLTVVDDHYGSLTNTRDVVDAAMKLDKHTGLFHFSGRGKSSWYDVARFIAENSEGAEASKVTPIKYADLNSLTPRPAFSYLNCDKYEVATDEKITSWQVSLLKFLQEKNYACAPK